MNAKKEKPLAGELLVDEVVGAAREKRAEKISVINLCGMAMPAEFFIICQSDTGVGNRAVADAIIKACANKHTHPWHYEGEDEGRWILIDFTDVVIHIMLPELRRYYDLESLWTGGKRTDVL